MKEIMPTPFPTPRRPSTLPATWEIMPQPLPASAAPNLPAFPIKPPNMVDNPYFDPIFAGQNAVHKVQADLAPSRSFWLPFGPSNLTDTAYFDPVHTARNAVQFIQAALAGATRSQGDSLARAQMIRDSFFRSGPAISELT